MNDDFGEVLIVYMMNEILFLLIVLGNQKYLRLMEKSFLIYERNIMRYKDVEISTFEYKYKQEKTEILKDWLRVLILMLF